MVAEFLLEEDDDDEEAKVWKKGFRPREEEEEEEGEVERAVVEGGRGWGKRSLKDGTSSFSWWKGSSALMSKPVVLSLRWKASSKAVRDGRVSCMLRPPVRATDTDTVLLLLLLLLLLVLLLVLLVLLLGWLSLPPSAVLRLRISLLLLSPSSTCTTSVSGAVVVVVKRLMKAVTASLPGFLNRLGARRTVTFLTGGSPAGGVTPVSDGSVASGLAGVVVTVVGPSPFLTSVSLLLPSSLLRMVAAAREMLKTLKMKVW